MAARRSPPAATFSDSPLHPRPFAPDGTADIGRAIEDRGEPGLVPIRRFWRAERPRGMPFFSGGGMVRLPDHSE